MRGWNSFFQKLDSLGFLGLRIWHFSYCSFRQDYGRFLKRKLFLHHPLTTLSGIAGYCRQDQGWSTVRLITRNSSRDIIPDFAAEPHKSLVAVGYCQKPLPLNDSGCPAGRFSHHCAWLESNVNLGASPQNPACRRCQLRIIGGQTLAAGIPFYIMTSALDVARDILLPNLEQVRFRHALFFLCPYAGEALIAPMLACGIEGFFLPYSANACREFTQFIAADAGDKPQITRVSRETWQWWLNFGDKSPISKPPQCVRMRGNILFSG